MMKVSTTTGHRRLVLVSICLLLALSCCSSAVSNDTATNDQTCKVAEKGTCIADGVRTKAADPECKDKHEKCETWAELLECDKNPKYMLHHCPVSCRVCE